MPGEELKSIHAALGKFLGKLNPEDAETLRIIRRNLQEAMEQVKNMENSLCIREGR